MALSPAPSSCSCCRDPWPCETYVATNFIHRQFINTIFKMSSSDSSFSAVSKRSSAIRSSICNVFQHLHNCSTTISRHSARNCFRFLKQIPHFWNSKHFGKNFAKFFLHFYRVMPFHFRFWLSGYPCQAPAGAWCGLRNEKEEKKKGEPFWLIIWSDPPESSMPT